VRGLYVIEDLRGPDKSHSRAFMKLFLESRRLLAAPRRETFLTSPPETYWNAHFRGPLFATCVVGENACERRCAVNRKFQRGAKGAPLYFQAQARRSFASRLFATSSLLHLPAFHSAGPALCAGQGNGNRQARQSNP
jgi:hypothetical protein